MPVKNVYRGGGRNGGGRTSISGIFGGPPARSSGTGFVPTGDLEADYKRQQADKLIRALKRGEIPGGSPEAKAKAEADALIERLAAAGQMPGGEKAAEQAIALKASIGLRGAAGALQKENQSHITNRALKAGAPILTFLQRFPNAAEEFVQASADTLGVDDDLREHFSPGAVELSSAKQTEEAGGYKLSPETAAMLGEGSLGSGGFRDVVRAINPVETLSDKFLGGTARWDPTSLRQLEAEDALSLGNAIGQDMSQIDDLPGGGLSNVVKVADFTGTAALDPLNLAGGGTGAARKAVASTTAEMLAKEGASAVLSKGLARRLGQETAEGLTKEAIEQGIIREGFRLGTTAEQKAALRSALIAQADEGAGRSTKGIITEGSKQAALKTDSLPDRFARTVTGKGSRTGEERAAEKMLDSALRYDRGGLRFAGRSLPRGTGDFRRKMLGDTLQVGDKYAAAQATVAGEQLAESLDRYAVKQAELAGKAEARRNAVIAKKIDAPTAKLEQSVEDAYTALSDAKARVGSGLLTPESIDDETRNVLAAISYQMDDAGMRARMTTAGGARPVPDPTADYLPFVSSLIGDHTDEFRKLLRAEDYNGILELLDTKVVPAGGFTPTWTILPKRDVEVLGKQAKDILKPLAKEEVNARKVAIRAVKDAKKAAEKARVAAEMGVKVDGKTALKLQTEAEKAAKYAEKSVAAADKVDAMRAALREGDTRKLLDAAPEVENIQAPVKDFVPGVIPTGKAREVGAKLKELVIPRAGIEASESLGGDVAQMVRDSQITGLALTKQEHDLGARLLRKALTDANKVDDAFKARVLEAMDLKGDVATLRKTVADGTPEAAFLDNLETLRQHTFELNKKYGLADVRKWNKDNYVKRKLAPGAQEALDTAVKKFPREFNQYSQFVSDAKGRAGQKGALKLRTKFKDKSIQEINAELGTALQEKGLLPEGKVYSEDIADLISTRYNDTLPALQLAQTADDMAKTLKSSVGTKLVERVRPGAADEAAKKASLAKRGMKPINLGEGGTIYAHPDIAPELEEYVRITGASGAVADVEKFLDGWMRLWKSYATVPLIGGTGFHVKNSIGNVFNNTLRGVALPAYLEAHKSQSLIRKAKKAFPDDDIPTALLKTGVPEDQVARIELAIENQIVDEGFLNTDLGERAASELKTGKKGPVAFVKRKAGAEGVEHMLGVPSGRAVGQLIEDNARLAHFFHVLDETGDAVQAAQSVRKYLFDYGDLTPFEKRGLKRVSAFYTFTRKNTPLQFQSLIDNPTAYTRANLAKNALMGNGDGEGSPGFMDEIGTPLGKSQSSFLSGTGNPVVGNIETPFDAATKTADPLLFLAGRRSAQEAAQGLFGNLSGGVIEVPKALGDFASGSSAFSGSELKDPEGNYKASPWLRLTDSVIPAGGKLMRLTGNKSAGNAENARIRIIKALTGIQAKEVTPKMREIAASQDLKTVEDVIAALKKAGVAVPTASELEQLGLLAED